MIPHPTVVQFSSARPELSLSSKLFFLESQDENLKFLDISRWKEIGANAKS
jgi:hypothetical protein